MPSPKISIPGKYVQKYARPARSEPHRGKAQETGCHESRARARKGRGPARSAQVPNRLDNWAMSTAKGSSAIPREHHGVALHLNQVEVEEEPQHVEGAVQKERQQVGSGKPR